MDLVALGVSPESVAAFFQVVMIDLTLAGDNAVVIGLAAAGLAKSQRGPAIFFGIIAATVLRIVFALATTTLLQIVGIMLIGGLLLLWVCWKMWRELQSAPAGGAGAGVDPSTSSGDGAPPKTLRAAIIQIIAADVSMSLDNVLAVAGAAHAHPSVLVFGLVLSIALMALAATVIARLLDRHRWIAYLGLAIILFVSAKMIWDGSRDVWDATGAAITENGLEFRAPRETAPSP